MAKNKIVVIKHTIYYNDKTETVKKIITLIDKNFKVENILKIKKISFDFDINIEISQNDDFVFPNNIATYTPTSNANLLDVFNDIIWLYLSSKKEFNEKLEQFENFVQLMELHEKYDHLTLFANQIGILDDIIDKGNCVEKNFKEFQNFFYAQYGIDLKEYLDKRPFDYKEDAATYKDRQINKNKNKLLKNIVRADALSLDTEKTIFHISSSKPTHKLIKSYSSYIEINPLISERELKNLIHDYYKIYSEFKDILEFFNKEYDRLDDDSIVEKNIKPIYDINSNVPHTIKGIEVVKKAMILYMIMEYNQTDNFDKSLRYFDYYWIKQNYRFLQIEGVSLFDLLNDKPHDKLDGLISLKQEKSINILSNETKLAIKKLLNLLKQSL